MNTSNDETVDTAWKGLYRVGGAAALIMGAMYVVAMAVYAPAYMAGPPPGSVIEWFNLFQKDWITGLFFLGLADVVIAVAWIPLALALYTALRRTNLTWMTIAIPLAFIGIAVYLATNIAFSMYSLSFQYAAATTDAQKSLILAAGQGLVTMSQGTGEYLGYPLVWLAGLIISVVMLRSKTFGKVSAYIGILGFAFLLAGLPTGAGYTATGPLPGIMVALVALSIVGGGILSLVWYILIGIRLVQLGRLETKALPQLAQMS